MAFYLWHGLYTILPMVVPLVWLYNRGADPGTPETADVLLSPTSRLISGALGAITFGLALVLLIAPDAIISVWAWKLTPLTVRVMGGCFAFAGSAQLYKVFEVRWSAVRRTQQSQLIWSALIVIATLRGWSDFDQTRLITWLFIPGVVLLFVNSLIVYLRLEGQRRKKLAQKYSALESLASH